MAVVILRCCGEERPAWDLQGARFFFFFLVPWAFYQPWPLCSFFCPITIRPLRRHWRPAWGLRAMPRRTVDPQSAFGMPLNSLELLFSDFLVVVLLMSVDLSAWVPRAISFSEHVPLWGTLKHSVELNTYRCRHTECFNDSNICQSEHLAYAHRLTKHFF